MSELIAAAKETVRDAADKQRLIEELVRLAVNSGYEVAEIDDARPWGGFIRFDNANADAFVEEFFSGVDPVEARLGNPIAELSPKLLVVAPGRRLSWQKHARRAERWRFLTEGAYHKSTNPDDMGNLVMAHEGDEVQFEPGECHRLVGREGEGYTLVAEIWQHTDLENPSNEEDIVRLQDDYKR